jgi:hypothetical protein
LKSGGKILNIIHKDCDEALAKDKSLPINSYLVTYLVKDTDNYGKGAIKKIKWTEGRVNPKVYGYVSKEKKKRK